MKLYGILIKPLLRTLIWLLLGASARWAGCLPEQRQRIYFANHTSHLDTIALWSVLPRELRNTTRPVAARDYWNRGIIRCYIAQKVLNAVLIKRQRHGFHEHPLEPAINALKQGDSLIVFPEGTRAAERLPGTFKAGLYSLAKEVPEVELVPVYLENLYRSMPKGQILPVPMTCTVWIGHPIHLHDNEPKSEFLERARQAIMEMT